MALVATASTAAPVKIGLVGAGTGGAALLDRLLDWPDGSVTVVVDPRPDAPGLRTARAVGIPTAAHHLEVFTHPVDLVLEVTGRTAVLEDLLRAKPPHVEVIGAASLRFFWALLESQALATRQLQVQLDLAMALRSTANPTRQIAIATRRLAEACGVDRCAFLMLDPATGLVAGVTAHLATGEPDPHLRSALGSLRDLPLADLPFVAEAVARREPIEIEDPAASPLLPPGLAGRCGITSLLVLPILRKDHAIGVCVLDAHREARRFTPGQIALAMTLANQIALGLENTGLFEESDRRRRSAEALAETSRLITQSLDPEDLGRRITESLRTILGGHAAALFLRHAESEDLVAVAVSGDDGPAFHASMVMARETGAAGLAVLERHPVVTPDLLADPRIALSPDDQSRLRLSLYRAVLAVPLTVQHMVIGALSLRDQAGRVFTREDIALAQALADQAAVALENARLYAEATRRQRQAETLARLAQVVTASLELPKVLESVAQAATALLPASGVRIWVAEGEHLVLRSEDGTRGTPGSGERTELAFGTGLAGHVALTREPLAVEDALADPRTVNSAWMREEGFVSFLATPLLVQERLLGVLSLLTRHRHRFSPEEVASLASFGTQAAIAIENATLLSELRARQSRLETLVQVSCELSRIQPLESLLGRIAEACGRLLHSDSVGIRVLDGDDLVLAGAYGDAQEVMVTPRLKVGESLSGIVAATSEPLVVHDAVNDPRMIPAHRDAYRRGGYRDWLGVPVTIGDQLVGVVSVRTRRTVRFSPQDLALATAFASQAAVALENSRLLQRVQHAYDELSQTQEQLTQAQKMEAVGRLAGGIAHDFNNLLTVILGRTQLLLQALKPGDPLHRGLDLIQTTGQRAADLTRQLLAFSRKQVLRPVVLDLNAVAVNMEQMLRRLIGEDIALVTTLDPGLGRVLADPGQLEQVIMNLAVNARDAMPQGGRLTLETANVEFDALLARRHAGASPGSHVMLTVSDTGVGIPPEHQPHIFEPFFTTKEQGKGTGLGLATVYGIVKQSGGTIDVASTPECGATFQISLPRVSQTPEPVTVREPVPHLLRGTETVLLVEDEEGVRELARDILRANGYTVLEARHGGEALLVCERHPGPIHLLLTDCVMPQMSGRELADRLSSLRADLRVLYMSGYTEDAVVQRGAGHPGAVFFQKPFLPAALVSTVRAALDEPSRELSHDTPPGRATADPVDALGGDGAGPSCVNRSIGGVQPAWGDPVEAPSGDGAPPGGVRRFVGGGPPPPKRRGPRNVHPP